MKDRKIIFTEIAPNMMSYLFMTFILQFGGAILIAATLDFIGLGPTKGISLGLMMQNAVMWSALHAGHVVVVHPAGDGDHGHRGRAVYHERGPGRGLQPQAAGDVSREPQGREPDGLLPDPAGDVRALEGATFH
jgi:hypothetical protein